MSQSMAVGDVVLNIDFRSIGAIDGFKRDGRLCIVVLNKNGRRVFSRTNRLIKINHKGRLSSWELKWLEAEMITADKVYHADRQDAFRRNRFFGDPMPAEPTMRERALADLEHLGSSLLTFHEMGALS